mmetsp:Transcript_31109/g.45584  ORF Transcript_31109/g.45584 Transcript_31109/m.45584 type:complete len:189 (-) Transcript_31109:594-1160(-)
MVACAPNMADLNSNLSVSPIVAGAKCSTASTSIGMALPKPNARDAAMRRKIRLQKLKLLRERNSARNIELEEDETKPSVHDAMNLDGPSSKKQQRMIRNRESAALSRKRKRDRITYLEAEVERLKQINDELLRKLEKYEAASSMISVSHQARQLPHNVKPQVQISARFNPSGSAVFAPPSAVAYNSYS